MLGVLFYLALYMVGVGVLYGYFEDGWTFIDGIYYSVISGTTVSPAKRRVQPINL